MTLKHFHSRKWERDFTAVAHANGTILLSIIPWLSAPEYTIAEHYDLDGTFDSSHGLSCPDHPISTGCQIMDKFSAVMFSHENSEIISFANYMFSYSEEEFTNVNLEYKYGDARVCQFASTGPRSYD
jgi:hypothetical protein